jgi:uridine kinase
LFIAFIGFVICLKSYKTSYDGGNKNTSDMVIHISGASGSGKTTLGKKLAEKLSFNLKDLDDLRDEFTKEYGNIDEIKYQKYINEFINEQKKPLLLVGLSDNPRGNKELYYDIPADYKYYIDLDDKTTNTQKCMRFIKGIPNNTGAMNDLVNNNQKFIKLTTEGIHHECDINETIRMNEKWKKDYERMGYKVMSVDDIYREIALLL